jgi:hypothetical protein
VLRGRDVETQQILDNCSAGHLAVIVSTPGLGTTALLRQGAAPGLRERGFITAVLSAWQGRYFSTGIKETIAEAVREQADDSFFAANDTLAELLERVRSRTGRRLALLLDQFEDYLRCHPGTNVSDAFDAELAYAVSTHDAAFVIAIQEYALPAFERLSQLIPNLLGYRLSLSPLTLDSAREVVTMTAAERGMSVEPAVVEALVSAGAVTRDSGVQPFLLTCGLNRLLDAELRLSSTLVRRSTLESHGGPERLVLESLDDEIGDLNSSHTELLFRWGNILISPAPHRRLSVSEKGLAEYSGKLNRFMLSLLPILMEKRLIRSVEMPDGMRYELARESLVPIVRDWWERREAALIAKRRAAFRMRSLSVAVGSIVTLYAVWLLMTIRK